MIEDLEVDVLALLHQVHHTERADLPSPVKDLVTAFTGGVAADAHDQLLTHIKNLDIRAAHIYATIEGIDDGLQ